jgi:hypothetical protein
MANLSTTHKHKVQFPVVVRGLDQANAQGVTNHVSKRFIRFWIDKPLSVKQGAAVMLFVRFPKELTVEPGVLMRARAKVMGVRQTYVAGVERQTYTAKLDWYDFMITAPSAPKFVVPPPSPEVAQCVSV